MTKMSQNEYYGNVLVLCTYYAEISLDMKGSHANTETYPGIADNCRSRSVLHYYHPHTNMASNWMHEFLGKVNEIYQNKQKLLGTKPPNILDYKVYYEPQQSHSSCYRL